MHVGTQPLDGSTHLVARAPSGTQVAMAGSCESLVAGGRKLADQPQPSTPKRGCDVPCIQILGL